MRVCKSFGKILSKGFGRIAYGRHWSGGVILFLTSIYRDRKRALSFREVITIIAFPTSGYLAFVSEKVRGALRLPRKLSTGSANHPISRIEKQIEAHNSRGPLTRKSLILRRFVRQLVYHYNYLLLLFQGPSVIT